MHSHPGARIELINVRLAHGRFSVRSVAQVDAKVPDSIDDQHDQAGRDAESQGEKSRATLASENGGGSRCRAGQQKSSVNHRPVAETIPPDAHGQSARSDDDDHYRHEQLNGGSSQHHRANFLAVDELLDSRGLRRRFGSDAFGPP